MTEKTDCRIYFAVMAGEHVSKAAEIARAANCEFFVFNDRLLPSDLSLLPTGSEIHDCPEVSRWYLAGRIESEVMGAVIKRHAREAEKKLEFDRAYARLSPEDRRALGLVRS